MPRSECTDIAPPFITLSPNDQRVSVESLSTFMTVSHMGPHIYNSLQVAHSKYSSLPFKNESLDDQSCFTLTSKCRPNHLHCIGQIFLPEPNRRQCHVDKCWCPLYIGLLLTTFYHFDVNLQQIAMQVDTQTTEQWR